MHPDHDPNSHTPPPGPPSSPGPAWGVPAGGRPGGGNPWVAAGVTTVAAVIAVVLIVMSGGGDATAPAAMPEGPDLPTSTNFTLPPAPTFPGMPTAIPTQPGTPAPGGAPTPTATRTGSMFESAETDTDPFTPQEWFPEPGEFSIQKRPYNQLAQDSRDCQAAEPGMRRLLGADCIGIIRSLWTDSTKAYVGSLSVVSLTDSQAAKSLANRLSAGQSDGAYVSFITPPSGSGVKFSEQTSTWVGTATWGHFLIVTEVARTNGAGPDNGSKQVSSDLYVVAVEHINVQMWE